MSKNFNAAKAKMAAAACIGILGLASCAPKNDALRPTANTFSKRCSLTETQLLAGFNTDVDGFAAGENVTSIELVDSVPNSPYRMHEGSHCLQVNCPDLPAREWRSVVREYPDGLDLSKTPVVSFGVNTAGGAQAADYYVRLTLSKDKQTFESIAQATTNDWNVTIFDLNDCDFLDDIRRVEFAFMNNSDSVWHNAAYQLDGFEAGLPIDLSFTIDGSASRFTATGGEVSQQDGQLVFDFKQGGVLSSPSLKNSRNRVYNPPLEDRNTVFFVMENRSSATKVRFSFITTEDSVYDEAKSKTFDLAPNSPKQAYYFNLSDVAAAHGSLAGFRLTPEGGEGRLLVDRITFEQEKKIEPFAGSVTSCTADAEKIKIAGTLLPEYASRYKTIAVYVAPMYSSCDNLAGLEKICELPAAEAFSVDTISLHRAKGASHLSSRFLAVAKNDDGTYTKVAPYFYIENWRDHSENPYEFSLPELTVSVVDYGAKGDGFTNDNKAIQAAIDDVSKRGGGRVVLPGDTGFYGRRFVATNIMLKSNVDLHLERGAVLWQSQNETDYDYLPAYGHDVVIPNIPWTHSLYVNLPLIQAKEVENIKITGEGTIRMADTYCVDSHLDHYARTCTDRIHIIPIGFYKVNNMELTDFEITRSNNYHTAFYFSKNLYVGNIRMHEVKCVSGDGIGVSMGTRDLRVDRTFFESNDDGIVLTSSYGDPRGGTWWWEDLEADHTVSNIEVYSSYINSGGGKAIALIPWGTTNPDQNKQAIKNIRVSDCVLKGGYSVGTWPDNPFDGKPFDNTEQDDYVAVFDFDITGNTYLSACDLLCIRPTSFHNDCGIPNSSTLRNGNFADGLSYWATRDTIQPADGLVPLKNARIEQTLNLAPGKYTLTVEAGGKGEVKVENEYLDVTAASRHFDNAEIKALAIPFEITAQGDFTISVSGIEHASLKSVALQPQ